jgi:hypothetical protein
MVISDNISADQLAMEARKAPLAWSQRLGFLLELVEVEDAASALLAYVQEVASRVVPLDASLPRTGAERSKHWLVAINTDVEADF